jgi:6-phosphogluconolactonase
VRRSFDGPSRIRGAVGTGKSVVGLHRAAYLARTQLLRNRAAAARLETLTQSGRRIEEAVAVANLHARRRPGIVLLGMGDDGHTASLFPHHPLLHVDDVTCAAVLDSPKPPPERVTFTLPVLRAARSIVFLATGEEKAGPVAQIMAGPDEGMPSSLLGGDATIVLCDEAAASQTPRPDG